MKVLDCSKEFIYRGVELVVGEMRRTSRMVPTVKDDVIVAVKEANHVGPFISRTHKQGEKRARSHMQVVHESESAGIETKLNRR